MSHLLIGLGNPGKKYQNNRHNAGILVLKSWLTEQAKQGHHVTPWQFHRSSDATTATLNYREHTVDCLFPLTFMNKSGRAVSAAANGKWWQFKSRYPAKNILIIHDDLDLPLGTYRIKKGGSARGHNGVRSIQQALGHDQTTRLLVGISRPQNLPVRDYVLQNFSQPELSELEKSSPQAFSILESFLESSSPTT